MIAVGVAEVDEAVVLDPETAAEVAERVAAFVVWLPRLVARLEAVGAVRAEGDGAQAAGGGFFHFGAGQRASVHAQLVGDPRAGQFADGDQARHRGGVFLLLRLAADGGEARVVAFGGAVGKGNALQHGHDFHVGEDALAQQLADLFGLQRRLRIGAEQRTLQDGDVHGVAEFVAGRFFLAGPVGPQDHVVLRAGDALVLIFRRRYIELEGNVVDYQGLQRRARLFRGGGDLPLKLFGRVGVEDLLREAQRLGGDPAGRGLEVEPAVGVERAFLPALRKQERGDLAPVFAARLDHFGHGDGATRRGRTCGKEQRQNERARDFHFLCLPFNISSCASPASRRRRRRGARRRRSRCGAARSGFCAGGACRRDRRRW